MSDSSSDSDSDAKDTVSPLPNESFLNQLQWRRTRTPERLSLYPANGPQAQRPSVSIGASVGNVLRQMWGLGSNPRAPRPPETHMGEDNAFYFDKEYNMWVERGKELEYRAQAARPPPPPPSAAATSAPTASRPIPSRGRWYVDATGKALALAPPPPPTPASVPPPSFLIVTPPLRTARFMTPASPRPDPVAEDDADDDEWKRWDLSGSEASDDHEDCHGSPIDLTTFDWDAELAAFERTLNEWAAATAADANDEVSSPSSPLRPPPFVQLAHSLPAEDGNAWSQSRGVGAVDTMV